MRRMSCLQKIEDFNAMMLIIGQSNRIWHYWAGRYPGSVGCLISPSYGKRVPIDYWMPFVLDNGAFLSWRDGTKWDADEWRHMLAWVRMNQATPLWAVVPDYVGNMSETIALWGKYAHEIKQLGWNAAFAVQDGMSPNHVPKDADIVFVGGTDGWKFRNLKMWTDNFPRVHCARVNAPEMIERCEELGCESVDGTGWFRDPSREDKIPAIKRFIEGHRSSANQMKIECVL